METWRLSHVKYCEKCKRYFYPNALHVTVRDNCPDCNSILRDTGMTYEEYSKQPQPSSDSLILKKLQELKETDPVKYEIAMMKYKQKLAKDFHQQEQNIPKCPICQSTNIHKISTANKVGSVALIGLFSVGHISKTFKCDNCGAKF